MEIVEPDVAASNGYLHYVDGVLMPPDLMTSLTTYNEPGGSYEGLFDTLLEGMGLTDMLDDYKGLNGPFTVSVFFFFSREGFVFRRFLLLPRKVSTLRVDRSIDRSVECLRACADPPHCCCCRGGFLLLCRLRPRPSSFQLSPNASNLSQSTLPPKPTLHTAR